LANFDNVVITGDDVPDSTAAVSASGRLAVTWGQLRSTIPPLTSVAWTTAMSGMNPGKTGISEFVEIDFANSKVILDCYGNSAAGNKPG